MLSHTRERVAESALRVRLRARLASVAPHAYRVEVAAVAFLAADLTTGDELKDWILIVVGNLFSAFLAIRAFGHFVKKEWGEMVTMGVGAVFVAALVWFPDDAKDVLGAVWEKVMG
ncbi:hypothetical protein ACIPSE_45200 [Streptomyces sp. NPDC090106]|uniref:hypothetical protein n=1 Tax=Streptomyces sp. NPDC090106 TaxID=3365946 RepID=UPI0037FFDE12